MNKRYKGRVISMNGKEKDMIILKKYNKGDRINKNKKEKIAYIMKKQ